jgi:hypothetical protein
MIAARVLTLVWPPRGRMRRIIAAWPASGRDRKVYRDRRTVHERADPAS